MVLERTNRKVYTTHQFKEKDSAKSLIKEGMDFVLKRKEERDKGVLDVQEIRLNASSGNSSLYLKYDSKSYGYKFYSQLLLYPEQSNFLERIYYRLAGKTSNKISDNLNKVDGCNSLKLDYAGMLLDNCKLAWDREWDDKSDLYMYGIHFDVKTLGGMVKTIDEESKAEAIEISEVFGFKNRIIEPTQSYIDGLTCMPRAFCYNPKILEDPARVHSHIGRTIKTGKKNGMHPEVELRYNKGNTVKIDETGFFRPPCILIECDFDEYEGYNPKRKEFVELADAHSNAMGIDLTKEFDTAYITVKERVERDWAKGLNKKIEKFGDDTSEGIDKFFDKTDPLWQLLGKTIKGTTFVLGVAVYPLEYGLKLLKPQLSFAYNRADKYIFTPLGKRIDDALHKQWQSQYEKYERKYKVASVKEEALKKRIGLSKQEFQGLKEQCVFVANPECVALEKKINKEKNKAAEKREKFRRKLK